MNDTAATWPALAEAARAALRYWDAWCPDDGRPLAALNVAEEYARGLVDPPALLRAATGLRQSLDAVEIALATDPLASPAQTAANAVSALVCYLRWGRPIHLHLAHTYVWQLQQRRDYRTFP